MSRAFLRRCALSKLEVADTRAPVEAGGRRIILAGVVESTIIHRIDGDITVVAPAVGGSTLASGAIKKMLLSG